MLVTTRCSAAFACLVFIIFLVGFADTLSVLIQVRLPWGHTYPGHQGTSTWSTQHGVRFTRTSSIVPEQYSHSRQRIATIAHAAPESNSDMAQLQGSTFQRLRQQLPFITDPSLVSPEVTYSAAIHKFNGQQEYCDAMRQWKENLPQRLESFEVSDVQLFQLEPGRLQARATYRFIAPLPPPSKSRGLPPDMVILPGDRVRVQTDVRSELILDKEGRIAKHTDTITNDYDIPATISRYEFLTAQRLGDLPPVWYYKVLETTTKEEADYLAGGQVEEGALQKDFYAMVLRNLLKGIGFGYLIFYGTKFLLYWMSTAPTAGL